MDSMASAIGVSVPVLRFLLCFVATIPVSFLWRLVPGTLPKHLYSALSGAIISYLSFGFSSNLHFLVPMTLGYGSMLLFRRRCGTFTFFAGFGYLIGWWVDAFEPADPIWFLLDPIFYFAWLVLELWIAWDCDGMCLKGDAFWANCEQNRLLMRWSSETGVLGLDRPMSDYVMCLCWFDCVSCRGGFALVCSLHLMMQELVKLGCVLDA